MSAVAPEALSECVVETLRARGADSSLLQRHLAEARRAWPGIDVPTDEVLSAMLARDGQPLDVQLQTLDLSELYIAVGCARGDDRAIAALEARYFPGIAPALRRIGLAAAEHDDVFQIMRERLLLPRGDEPPRIVGLAGKGDLSRLLRVVAIRTALNLRRRDRRLVLDDGALAERLLADSEDPRRIVSGAEERALARAAIEAAFAALRPREKTLLRLSLLDRMSIDDIGALYQVHRATAARWLQRLRDRIGRETRRQLRQALGRPDVDTLLERVQSRLELSLSRLLG